MTTHQWRFARANTLGNQVVYTVACLLCGAERHELFPSVLGCPGTARQVTCSAAMDRPVPDGVGDEPNQKTRT